MKSDRRHELQHNMLADSLMATGERIRPYMSAIVGLSLLIVASLIAWAAWRAHSSEQVAEAWEAMPGPLMVNNGQLQQIGLSVVPPEYYESKVINGFPGTLASDWAALYQAEYSLLIGGASASKNQKNAADQALNDALQRYEKILKTDDRHWIAERATFGKARTLEFLGRVDDALTTYQDLNRDYPKNEFKDLAEQRIEDLQQPDVKQFYDLYLKWKPKPSPTSDLKNIGSLPDEPPVKSGSASSSGTTSGSGAIANPMGSSATVDAKPPEPSAKPLGSKETTSLAPKPEPAKPAESKAAATVSPPANAPPAATSTAPSATAKAPSGSGAAK